MEDTVDLSNIEHSYKNSEDLGIKKEKKEKEKVKEIKDSINSADTNYKKENESIVTPTKKKFCPFSKRTWIIIIVASVVVVSVAVVGIVFALKPQSPENEDTSTNSSPSEPLIKNEFTILTRPGDLKQVTVTQKSKEENILNGVKVINDVVRKTNYDIYFISETEPENKERMFYSKMYQGVVTIRSECTEEGEDCEPQELVDLIKARDNLGNLRNIRNLQNSEAFKDQPVALCLFNITDNNVITTITCPESLSYVKRNEIILDLYFFRPPAAERADKIGDNITLNINTDEKTKKTFIHETNGGVCNIYNNWGSLCTTDMNTTLDKDNNLLTYDEQAYTFIRYNEQNTFTKNKITKLVDVSENIEDTDIKNYEKSLHNLLPLLDPYMKEEVQFTEEDYEDLYNIITDKKKSPELQSYSPKKIKNTFRNLAQEKIKHIKEAELFNERITPIQVNLVLPIDPGINSDKTGVYTGIYFNEKIYNFSSIEMDSFVDEILEKLSKYAKAGNTLAAELYDKIYYKFENLVNELSIKINSIEDYLKYYDIIDVFNSTLINYSYKRLPSDIVRISNALVRSLTDIMNNIRSGDIKHNAEILGNDIYSYVNQIKILISTMLNNLGTLSNILITKNNIFTVITNHYSNNTASSLVNIIQKMKIILETYYIYEYNMIYPKMEELMEILEQNNNDTLASELTSLRNLYTNLKERIYSINDISDSDYQLVLNNLQNSLQYPFDIISLIKEYLQDIMNIKSNGYLISDEDIKAFNESFTNIIIEAEQVVKILDNTTIIDFAFDEIMTKFRESYITTINFMEQIKLSNFTLEEDVLNKTLFTTTEKNRIENDLKTICDEMLVKIKEESDVFINKIKEYLDKFLEDNLDDLNNIIIDLSVIFSEEAIQSLSNSFENSLNLTLDKFTQITKDNINLTEKYINHYYDMIRNDTALKKLLQNYYLDYNEIYRPYYDQSRTHQFPVFDIIYGKMRTSAYIYKYSNFIANLNYTEEYLINQLNMDITNEYREIFIKIKEELTSIINNKLNEKFPDFYEVNFFDNHIKIIDKLTTRLDKYFSKEIFESKYKKIINENINNNLNLIRNARNDVIAKNDYIKTFSILSDNTNDMCITFRRKVCYGCTNCVSYTFFYDRFCFILRPYDLNYLDLKKNTYESVNNYGKFDEVFNSINNLVKEKVDGYNYIVGNLNLNVLYIKNETLKRNITGNYLVPLNNYIKTLLEQKFENALLRYTYNYYESSIRGKLELIFKDVFNIWKKSYNKLAKDIRDNTENIKYSNFEFTEMAENYRTIIQVDQTENYYNSIILFERYELNYTISYYYNYLMKIINKSFNYIIQNIEMYENDYNEILKEKKAELKNSYNNYFITIANSEEETINLDNQLKNLSLNDSDFFKVRAILTKNIQETDNALQSATDDIWDFEMILDPADKYSLVMRYYLENKIFGKLIEEYYDMFDIYLDLNKFKETMLNSWIFDKDDFINMINKALYSTNIEIRKELFVKLEEYSVLIEEEITKYLTDDIEIIINNLFSNAIKEVTSVQTNKIIDTLENLYDGILSLVRIEANEIIGKTYLLNIDNIKEMFKNIENSVKINLNESITYILNQFNESIYQNLYTNCFDTKLEEYLAQAENIISSQVNNKYVLLNTSFNIGETIYNLTKEVINNYKNVIKKKIEIKYNEYYTKIKTGINLEMIYTNIENNFKEIYQTELSSYLTSENNCTTCSIYNFEQNTLSGVNYLLSAMGDGIKNGMNSLQGNNYQATFQCNLDFTNSGNNVIKPLCESMKSFLSFEKEEQVSRINENIQNSIKNNLEDFLNTVVPSFGNEFFERIIDYNINFKLSNLYENLHYAIGQTILYYEALEIVTAESNLPSDLKDRLINLNDLDITINDKVYEIKELAERKLNELIKGLKYEAKNAYTHFLIDDETIKNSFSQNITEKIDFTLEKIMPDVEKEYQKTLEKYLKEKFMKDFSDSLDEKTNYMLNIFYEERNNLARRLNRLFNNTKDEDLNAVNNKINKTLQSIQDYKNFYRNFSLTQSAKDFFINYPENKLLPIFKKFNKDLYDSMKLRIETEINNKSKTIENLDIQPFKDKLNEIYNELLYGYMNFIHTEIYKVCETDYIYKDNLNNKLNEYEDNSRRRLRISTVKFDDSLDEIRQMYESRYIEDSMDQLVIKAINTRNYINTLNTFVYYSNIISGYQSRLNIDYKYIRDRIEQNKYQDEIHNFLMNKLFNLSDKLYLYYKDINSNFYALKSDLEESITNIKNALDSCYNYMANIINNEYGRIYNNYQRVDETKTNYIEELETLRYKHQAENMMNNGSVYIENLYEYAEFKSDLTLVNGKILIPKFKAKITGKTVPKNVLIYVTSENGFCYEHGHYFNISLNDINYTMTVEYDSKSRYINLTTYTDISEYEYNLRLSTMKGEITTEQISMDNYVRTPKCQKVKRNLDTKETVTVPETKMKESTIIFK